MRPFTMSRVVLIWVSLLCGALAENPKRCGGGHQQCSAQKDSSLPSKGASLLQASYHTVKNYVNQNITCALEEKIKDVVEYFIWHKHKLKLPTDRGQDIPQHTKYKTQGTAIRQVFHDAQDHNSLKLKSIATNTVTSIDSASYGDYGGIDGCVYIPFPDWRLGSWIHKKELNFPTEFVTLHYSHDAVVARAAQKYAIESCEALCCTNTFLTTQEKHALCGPQLSICNPKIRHPIDTWHVRYQEPKWIHSLDNLVNDTCIVDMAVFGALLIIEKASGPKIEMTWGRRQADCTKLFANSKVDGEFKPFPIWLDQAPMNSFETLHTIVNDFARIGFSEREMAALMGAHSFGKMHKYAGDFAPREWTSGFCNSTRSTWGEGAFWDRTPEKLDNDYFKIVASVNPAEKEVCCGPMVKDKGCYTSYDQKNPKNNIKHPMQFWNGSEVPGQGCNHKYCMRSAIPWGPRNKYEGNWAMLSTQVSLPKFNETKYKAKARPTRLTLLAADLSLAENAKTLDAVKEFAHSEAAFQSAFHDAFDKTVKLGYPSGSIQTCSGFRTPSQVTNLGQPCWKDCKKGGFCSFCGDGACCRQWWNDPPECKWVKQFKGGGHKCVETVAKQLPLVDV